jgi:hypothetical protein
MPYIGNEKYSIFKDALLNKEGVDEQELITSWFDDILDKIEKIIDPKINAVTSSVIREKLCVACFFAKKASSQNLSNLQS